MIKNAVRQAKEIEDLLDTAPLKETMDFIQKAFIKSTASATEDKVTMGVP